MGELIGGAIAMLVLSALLEWALVKRFVEGSIERLTWSVVLAFVFAVVTYAYSGGYNAFPRAIIIYGPGALLVFAIGRWRRNRANEREDEGAAEL